MKNSPVWLQLYFVLASLLGLVLIVIGSVTLINTGLNATVLKTPSTDWRNSPPMPYFDTSKIEANTELTDEEKQTLVQWQEDYLAFQENDAQRDYQAEGRRQAIAFAVAILVTGVPIFALHAPIVFRQARR